jgi:hypothetical protein
MKNYSLHPFFALLCLILYTGLLTAQTKNFATGTTVPATDGSGVTSVANAKDTSLSTAARITTPGVAGSRSLELSYTAAVAAETTTYVKIASQDDIISPLVAGGLSGLLSALVSQSITVEAKNGSTSVLLSTNATYSKFSNERLRIIQNAAGEFFIMITPASTYDRIVITNKTAVATLTTKWLDVYGAYNVTGTGTCVAGPNTSYTANGVTLLSTGNVTNAVNAIDSNTSNFSTISLNLLATSSYVEQTIYFEGASAATDVYYLRLKVTAAVALAGKVEILSYKGATLVSTINLSTLNSSIVSGQLSNVPITPGIVDRIAIRITGGLSVTQALDLYGIVKGTFAVTVTGNGASYQVGQTATLTATPDGCNYLYTYAWNGASTATTQAINPSTATPGTYNFGVTVTDIYGITKTATASIIVEVPPVAGTVSVAQYVCDGDLPGNLSLSGYTGTIQRWEKATDAAFTTPVTIANTTAALAGSVLGALTQTVYVRAVVKHNSYAEVFTPAVALTVKHSTWNGTAWSEGTPDANTTIYITGPFTPDADIYGCRMEVSNNAVVTVPNGKTITLNGNLKVLSGSFTLEHNAHLNQITNTQNTGNITVKRNSSSLYRQDYTIWSSPVAGQELKAFSPLTLENRFYAFDGVTNNWVAVAPVGNNFATGQGYLIRMPNALSAPGYNNGTAPTVFNGEFKGVPNNGTITVPTVAYVANSVQGYNIIGNPYPSPINVHDFFAANAANLGPDSGLYFWRKRNDTNATSYATLTMDAYTANAAAGGGAEWETMFNTTATNQWVINPGQGFFVQAKTSGIVFNNSMRRGTVHNNQFFKQAVTDTVVRSRYWLNLTGAATAFSQMAVVYTQEATLGLDFGREARAQSGNTVKLYSLAENTSLSIQARPAFTDSDVVALGYSATAAGSYTITLFRKDGVFDGQAIFLKDKVLNTLNDLTVGTYTFATEAGTFNDRFEVVYQNISETMGLTTVLNANAIAVYKKGSTLVADGGKEIIKTIEVYDIRGRLLYSKTAVNETNILTDEIQVQNQILIVNVSTEKGRISKKIAF